MKKILFFISLAFLFSFTKKATSATIDCNAFELQEVPQGKKLPIDTLLLQSYHNKMLTEFYDLHGNSTAWLENSNTRKFLLGSINSGYEDGLNPKEYALEQLYQYESSISSLPDAALVDYDILLTLELQKYVSQLSNGRLNPRELYKDWDLHKNLIDVNGALNDFKNGDSLVEKTARLKPHHLVYGRLKNALKLINSYPQDTIACIEFKAPLRKMAVDSALITIKEKLMYWGDREPGVSLDASYDDITYEAIKKFQARHGLTVDGIIGKKTVDALNYSKNLRREQIIVNLERWKWFPRDFGQHYFIINIPEYNLKIIKNNDTIETKRVVVGLMSRKTPILSSTFNAVILNPTWTVPPTILEEDILPAALKSRDYFASKNIIIYNQKNLSVSPWHWNPAKYKDYRYVQSPGDENSLGNVKFNFPNKYSVYLHDTNHRDYFVKNFRSLSSGCIRLENPLPLAEYMLDDPKKWNMEKICEVIATKKTTPIALRNKINIHQLYWTAWMNQAGTLEFRSDIYHLDAELYEKLGN